MPNNWGSRFIKNEGKKPCKIMVVGEAPGEEEELAGKPFVGVSGQFMERYLGRCGIRRSDIYLANLFHHRPKGNKFDLVIGTEELNEQLEQLKLEIKETDPNIIIAFGAWPMYYLTGCTANKKNAEPGSGITTWRGSTMPCKLVEGYKVYITYHPAYVVRPQGFNNNPIFLNDLRRANEESDTKELPWPKYEEIIDPPEDELWRLVDELSAAEWLTVDIETFGDRLACVGFTDSASRAICLTHRKEGRNWEASQVLLKSKAKKNFQYGLFDINWLQWFYGWRTANYAWDTYVAQNNLMPGYPKTLEFLNSIHCRLHYYKDDRKSWKEKGDTEILFRYNCKDVISQHTTMLGQRKDMGLQ